MNEYGSILKVIRFDTFVFACKIIFRMAGHNPDERLAIEYYMTCEEMTNNPFKIDIIEAKRAVHDLQSNTQILKRIAEQYMPQQVTTFESDHYVISVG